MPLLFVVSFLAFLCCVQILLCSLVLFAFPLFSFVFACPRPMNHDTKPHVSIRSSVALVYHVETPHFLWIGRRTVDTIETAHQVAEGRGSSSHRDGSTKRERDVDGSRLLALHCSRIACSCPYKVLLQVHKSYVNHSILTLQDALLALDPSGDVRPPGGRLSGSQSKSSSSSKQTECFCLSFVAASEVCAVFLASG